MRRPELDLILGTMLVSQREVSDLNITVDKPPQVESNGQLVAVVIQPAIEKLTPFQTEQVALNLLQGNRRLTATLIKTGSCDSSYLLPGRARFRVNMFSQRGNYSVVLRKLTTKVPTFDELKLPAAIREVPKEKNGLVLVTGATGSGKSTTLAAILNDVNATQSIHIITLEDPVEFVHEQKKATFNQRELGTDFDKFATGLRAALRQAPKMILVGEMRDRETVEIGLSAAETGHLVLSTLHTNDAGQTINRILGMFEPEEQPQIRLRLADTLRWIVSQRLAPKITGGRHALFEIMGANLRTKESVAQGEAEGRTFYEIIEANATYGWKTFDQSAIEAFDYGVITEESALMYCSRRGPVGRGIDHIKKQRGEMTSDMTGLKVRKDAGGEKPAAAAPVVLKLK
jgi:twitching motility protein PilT